MIDAAVAAIRAGEPVVLPTDTVYGLCAEPTAQAARLVARLKGREERQPTALLAPSVDTLLELVPELHCPLMAAIGAEDHNPSPEVGERLRETLAQSPHETCVDLYEGAGHAFFADYRPSYRPAPAALLWVRVVPFLARHLRDAQGAG